MISDVNKKDNKEKDLAALRADINRSIIPDQNKKDLEEIPKDIREKMEFFPVKDMDEVVRIAFPEPVKKKARKGAAKQSPSGE